MSNEKSFLHIEEISEANKERLLQMRKTLFASVARNMEKEERKGMFIVSLAIFTEFERLTRHILEEDITKN